MYVSHTLSAADDLQYRIEIIQGPCGTDTALLCEGLKGYNSASGSVCACHAAALGSILGARGLGLWKFISRPATSETVYLSWLA